VRARNEVKDCAAYVIWIEERLGLLHPSKAKWWDQVEAAVQPADDLFSNVQPLPEYDHREPIKTATQPAVVEAASASPAKPSATPAKPTPRKPTFSRTW
jgi:hypothetical protein